MYKEGVIIDWPFKIPVLFCIFLLIPPLNHLDIVLLLCWESLQTQEYTCLIRKEKKHTLMISKHEKCDTASLIIIIIMIIIIPVILNKNFFCIALNQ